MQEESFERRYACVGCGNEHFAHEGDLHFSLGGNADYGCVYTRCPDCDAVNVIPTDAVPEALVYEARVRVDG